MSGSEDGIIEQLLKLSEYGTLEEARLEAVRSLAVIAIIPKCKNSLSTYPSMAH